MTAPTVKYPANDITPHGWWHVINDTQPLMRLKAYDGSIDFYLMGGHAIPDRYAAPEAVHIPRDGLKGLIPPWKHIDQKGATEDGTTQVDALYEPIEVQLTAVCKGRSPARTAKVVRDLIASIDAKQQSELGFLSHETGYWWAPVRWFQGAPPDPVKGSHECRQQISLRLRADHAFWQTYPDVATFGFIYESMKEEFDADYSDDQNLGPNWPQLYEGDGGGYCTADNGKAFWHDDGGFNNEGREVVNGPFKDFNTATNNQVVTIQTGSFLEITIPDGAENHIWARMGRNPDGTWNGYGIKLQIGLFGLRLSRYNNFVETKMREQFMFIPPLPREKWTLVAGYEGNERLFKVQRNGIEVLSYKESGTGSALGPSYRGVGFGMRAGAALITQATPATVLKVSAGDNATVTQSGFLPCTNIGDQPLYYEYTLFGPGVFRIHNGPGAEEYVEIGKILANQVVYVRTDPRKGRLVQDLSTVPPNPQQLNIFQQALKSFESFAFGNNVPPLLQQINSLFGIRPPQGNIYSLVDGRFSDDCAIPPKSPGNPAQPYFVKVEIDEGNADSKIIASGTPLRRYPL